MAGIPISPEVVEAWNRIKKDHTLRYMVFKLNDKMDKVVFEKEVYKTVLHEQMVDELPSNETRYIALNLDFTAKEGGERSKLVLIFWCPETASVKFKMVSSPTYLDLKKKCSGAAKYFERQSKDDMSFEALREEFTI